MILTHFALDFVAPPELSLSLYHSSVSLSHVRFVFLSAPFAGGCLSHDAQLACLFVEAT